MKKNRILSSIITIALCLSLIAGSTFALFTSSDEVNVAVTAGEVKVDAYLDSFKTFSMDKAQADMSFANGGTAAYANGTLTLDRVTPGDEITFNVNIDNNSNVDVQYRVKATMTGKLGEVLETYITFENTTVAAKVDDLGMAAVSDWNALAEGKTIVPMSILLPEEVGNEYQGAKADIAITVEAIQGNGEGMVLFGDENYDSLEEAIAAALADGTGAGDVITIAGKASIALPEGTSKVLDLMGLTINGHAYATLVVKAPEGSTTSGTCDIANVNMNSLSLVDESWYKAENGENAWEFTYLEFQGENSFNDVLFTDGIMVSGDNSYFEGCTFIGHNNDSSEYGNGTMYGAWVSNGSATFESCKFLGTRGLKMHEAYKTEVANVTVNYCYFDSLSEKPGVAIGTLNAATKVVITNNTFYYCQPGDQDLYIYETDTDVEKFDFTEENNVVLPRDILKPIEPKVIDGVYQIASTNNWSWMIENSRTAPIGTDKNYFVAVLTNDLDFMGVQMDPVSSNPNKYSYIKFDGQGHTISNFVIDVEELAAPFGKIHGTINDLHVEDAIMKSTHYAGGILGHGYATITNCSVTRCDISAINTNGKDGRHVGGIVGYHADAKIDLKNNTVTDVTITAEGAAAWLVGTCQFASKNNPAVQKDISGNVRNNVTVIDAGHLSPTSSYKGTVSNTHYAGYDTQLPPVNP